MCYTNTTQTTCRAATHLTTMSMASLQPNTWRPAQPPWPLLPSLFTHKLQPRARPASSHMILCMNATTAQPQSTPRSKPVSRSHSLDDDVHGVPPTKHVAPRAAALAAAALAVHPQAAAARALRQQLRDRLRQLGRCKACRALLPHVGQEALCLNSAEPGVLLALVAVVCTASSSQSCPSFAETEAWHRSPMRAGQIVHGKLNCCCRAHKLGPTCTSMLATAGTKGSPLAPGGDSAAARRSCLLLPPAAVVPPGPTRWAAAVGGHVAAAVVAGTWQSAPVWAGPSCTITPVVKVSVEHVTTRPTESRPVCVLPWPESVADPCSLAFMLIVDLPNAATHRYAIFMHTSRAPTYLEERQYFCVRAEVSTWPVQAVVQVQ